MNYFHDMVDNIYQKRIWRPWNHCGYICLHLRRHIWNSRVHKLSVTSPGHEGTPAWKRPNLHQAGDPIEKHTDLPKHGYIMEPPTMLLVPICRDMQLRWDKPPIPSPRNCMPGDTCFDDVSRNYAYVTWTQMYVTLQTKNVFHSKAVIILFF